MKGMRGDINYASFADNSHAFYEDYSKTSPYFYPFPVDLGRKRLNKFAVAECILLPWAIFAAVLWLLSFEVHYNHANQCYFLVGCASLFGLCFAIKAAQFKQHDTADHWQERHDPKWYSFLAVACTIAWVMGIVLGVSTFEGLSKSYYHLRDLNTVQDVDPASSGGQEFLDASILVFKNTSRVDSNLALGYKDSTVYCVAPITTGGLPFARYDFWAVGKDCCNAFGGSFTCGGSTSDPEAHSGLRLMNDHDRAFYRLAVTQAEAQYKIQAPRPLFFEWVKDASAEQNSFINEAKEFYMTAILVALLAHGTLVTCLAMSYDKRLDKGEFA